LGTVYVINIQVRLHVSACLYEAIVRSGPIEYTKRIFVFST